MKEKSLICRMNSHMRLKNLSNATITNYEREVSKFLDYFNIIDQNPTEDHIYQYLLHLRDIGVGHGKFKIALHAINYLFKNILQIHWRIPPVPYPKKQKKLPAILSYSEINDLLTHAINQKCRTFIQLLYCTGIRRKEIINLRITDIDSKRMTIFIGNSKGAKDRYIPIKENLLETLRSYYKRYQPEEFLFNGYRKGNQISEGGMQNMLKRTLTQTKLPKKINLHTFRHTFATHALEQGVSILWLQNVLGHANLISTLIYLQFVQRENKDFPDLLSNLKLYQ